MMPPPARVVIVGGGTAGWIAANLMARAWGSDTAVTLVEAPDIGTIGVGEGSTPSLRRFFELLGVTEQEWMPRCQATYKVSIRFAGWSPSAGPDYSHPFSTQVDAHTEQAFVLNCRNRRLGHDVPVRPDDFLLNARLAAGGLAPVTPPHFPFRMEYGYHFDAGLLGAFLREVATARGVVHREARVTGAVRTPDGDIAAVVTDTGEHIGGDLFVDCSGFAALLIERTLGVPFRSFRDNLFNDAAVVLPTAMDRPPPVETVATALSSGWCWTIPLRHRFGNGYVYSRDFQSADQAEAELRRHLGIDGSAEARHLTFRTGQPARHWERNCVAVGLSQGFIEPLEATALHLVLGTVDLFLRHHPGGDRAGFNAAIAARIEGVRDYIVAHYRLNTRNDTPYWRANAANTALSGPLRHLLDVWFRKGDLAAEIERQGHASHFRSLSWHCLLAGYGAFPPVSERPRGDVDFHRDRGVAAFLDGCSLNFPRQADLFA